MKQTFAERHDAYRNKGTKGRDHIKINQLTMSRIHRLLTKPLKEKAAKPVTSFSSQRLVKVDGRYVVQP